MRELLVLPVSRLGWRDALYLHDLEQELRSVLDVITAAIGTADDDANRDGDRQ